MNEVEESIREHRLFQPRQSILIAVSGGLDSMALLHILHELAGRHDWRISVAHFNHRLRGRSSDADEALVRKTAKRFHLPICVERAEVRAFAKQKKLSVEMAARQLRHEFLARIAVQNNIRSIALAHHADDQAELFFVRLLRGTGGQGLGGMRWENRSPSSPRVLLARPLLAQTKTALAQFAAKRRIPFREDATNLCLDIQRNRIRHELLPLLRKHYQPALSETILRTMEVVGLEAEFVGRIADSWLQERRNHRSRKKQVPGFGQIEFSHLPVPVQRRALQFQLIELGITPAFEAIELLRLNKDRSLCLSGPRLESETPKAVPARSGAVSFCVSRDASGFVRMVESKTEPFRAEHVIINMENGAGRAEFGDVLVRWKFCEPPRRLHGLTKPGGEYFDADLVGSTVELRHWRPGDRFQPIGMAQAVKLQDLFTNAKIPRQRRHELIVAVGAAGEIFWVEGLRIAERFKLSPRTIRCLQWQWQRF